MSKKILATSILAFTMVAAVGCTGKAAEPYNDARIGYKDDSPAEVYSMPDGFSNVASKCDQHGNRIYTIFHFDSPYGSVAVVPNDPSCKR